MHVSENFLRKEEPIIVEPAALPNPHELGNRLQSDALDGASNPISEAINYR